MRSASTVSTSIPKTQVLVTSGATEALTASIMGLVGAGEEVVLIEPSYDCYRPIALPSARVVRSVKLATAGLAAERKRSRP